ncbi:MAG TPA: hypothetical protein ENI82_03225 [Bacteroidetes bacterium]|nr:hypothetical protein [Bacteroidota bacterium]
MQRNFITIILLLVLLSSSCSRKATKTVTSPVIPNKEIPKPKVPVKTDEQKEAAAVKEVPNEALHQVYLVASLSKTPCYGKCPVFEVRIFSDGKVEFYGRKNVNLIGKFQAQASPQFIEQIKSEAKAINYMKLSNTYPENGKKILDLPNTISYIKLDQQEKMIRNNHHAPQRLLQFEKKLEAMINTLSYQKIQ